MVHPTPGTAFAVVVWRNPNGSPPSDAGVYDFVLWKQGGRWLAFALRTAYLHPILASDPPKGGWVIEDGALASVAGKGVASLVSEEEFLEFELEWEWKAAKGANSGVSYQLFGVNFWDVTGMEYQVVDDNGDPGTIKDNKQKSGARAHSLRFCTRKPDVDYDKKSFGARHFAARRECWPAECTNQTLRRRFYAAVRRRAPDWIDRNRSSRQRITWLCQIESHDPVGVQAFVRGLPPVLQRIAIPKSLFPMPWT